MSRVLIKNKTSFFCGFFILFISLTLGVISISGLWYKYPQPPQSEWDMGYMDRVREKPTLQELDMNKHEAREDYFRRITRIIDAYFVHWSPRLRKEIREYRTVSIYDNYILWAVNKVLGYSYFDERSDVETALDRGWGQCSQYSLLIANILDLNAIPTKIIRLNGHVVASGQLEDGGWVILDGNYGVYIPKSIEEIEKNSEMVLSYYEEIYKRIPERVKLPMEEIYGEDGNQVLSIVQELGWKQYYVERFSYLLIWLFPLCGVVISIFFISNGISPTINRSRL